MQCVLICAGKGTRMRPLTESTPKPLLPVCGKPILDHILEALPPEIDELILITHYLEEQIKDHCGTEFHGRRVQYVTQENPAGGTGDALLCAKELVHGAFLFMYADDIHGSAALEKVVKEDHAILAMPTNDPQLFGILELNSDGTLKCVVEKPEPGAEPSNLANIGGWIVDPTIFTYDIPLSPRGELEATDMLTAYAADHSVKIVEQDTWIPIGNPEQIKVAETILCPDYIDKTS